MKTNNQKHPFYMSPFSQKDALSHCHLHTEGLEQPSLWHRPSPVTTSTLSLSFSLSPLSLSLTPSLPASLSLFYPAALVCGCCCWLIRDSETKNLPSEISSNLSSLFLQPVCIERQSCPRSSTLDSSCSLGPLEKGGEATEEMTRNPKAASLYFRFRLPGVSLPH